MAGVVYLKTDKFQVKLEGIAFKVKDFEPLCSMDFVFPKGKISMHPPVVGLDVLRHPRDPDNALLLLCFGIGCVILRFCLGEDLPDPILNFLKDERISFVGFRIPEKRNLFPFGKLGLKESEVDVGFMAAKVFNDSRLKMCELADLARRVLGINSMVGLTDSRAFGRHQQIKSAICEVFVSSVIGMSLLQLKKGKKFVNSSKDNMFKNMSFPSLPTKGLSKTPRMKLNLNSLPTRRVFKMPVSNKEKSDSQNQKEDKDDIQIQAKEEEEAGGDDFGNKKPLKGILKCPSSAPLAQLFPSPPKLNGLRTLKRANSKGLNVSFKENKNTVLCMS